MRLTNSVRNQIAKAALAHAFDAQEKQHKEAEYVLADKVYNSIYPTSVQKIIGQLGKDYLYATSYVEAHYGKRYCTLSFGGEGRFYLPAHSTARFDAADPMTREIEKHQDACRQTRDLKDHAKSEMMGILNSVTTTKRLLEVWPEVAAFVPTTEQDTRNLPALQLDKLNQVLGLPPQ